MTPPENSHLLVSMGGTLIVQECETWVQYFLKNLAKNMVMEILSTSDMPRPFELSKVETPM